MFQNPISRPLLPCAQRYPAQAGALLRTWEDLALAQQWLNLTVVDLPECTCAVFTGTPKNKSSPAVVLPMALAVPTSMAQLAQIFAALTTRELLPADPALPRVLYLGIVEKDSSVVYYVLKGGIVSPLEVPEG